MKIIVIGCPGSGKSTFSQNLNKVLNIPLFHLDMLYHNIDGTHISKEELEEKLQKIFEENEKWIIDGNYQRTLEMRIKECDTIFLLDYPVEVCLLGAESRVGKKRDDLPWVEEKLNEEFKKTITSFSIEKLPQIYELLKKYKDSKKIMIFKSREEADNYLLFNRFQDNVKEIVMVTGNAGKYKVANDIFNEKGLKLIQEKLETPEIQSYNVEDVSAYSAIYAAKTLNKDVIKSDVGYFISALNGFPGPFVKYINGMLSSEEILKLMQDKTDRTILLKECLTYATPKGEIKQFINEEKATIALKAYGTGSVFDRIVIFDGQKLPKSMNTDEENIAHFKKTLKVYEDMAEYLSNNLKN